LPEVGRRHNTLNDRVISKQKFVTSIAALVLVVGIFAQGANAEGDVERGKVLGYTCLGCHGIDGYRNAYPSYRVPKLGGQKAGYLIVALQGYRDGTRKHPTMISQASSLSDQDIEDVAAYLATLSTDTVAAGGVSGTSLEAAQTCVACHGQNGISMSPAWPTLAGQHEDYLEHALKQYRDGTRQNVVMGSLVADLSDQTIAQLAAYFAGLEGLETSEDE
jgi:cytochrome c553